MTVTNQRRNKILKRDNNECQNCGLTTQLEIHHIQREKAGGSDEPQNLITLCIGCHKTLHMISGGDEIPIGPLEAWPEPTEIRGLTTPMSVAVLEVLKDGRDRGDPWGYTTPTVAAEAFDSRRQYTSRALKNLVAAGWIEQVGTGVYRFVEDPREENDEHDN